MTVERTIVAIHSLIWLSIESCVAYLLWAGLAGRAGRRSVIAGAVVVGECVVFAANGFRCPLSDLAEAHGADHGSVTDLFLPARLARNLPAIHVPILLVIGVLQARIWRSRRIRSDSRGNVRTVNAQSWLDDDEEPLPKATALRCSSGVHIGCVVS